MTVRDPWTGRPPIQDWEYWFRCYCNAMEQVEDCLKNHLKSPNELRAAFGVGTTTVDDVDSAT